MADSATEIDLDSVIDRLLEGELARYLFNKHPAGFFGILWDFNRAIDCVWEELRRSERDVVRSC
jgi:hypothetical protein